MKNTKKIKLATHVCTSTAWVLFIRLAVMVLTLSLWACDDGGNKGQVSLSSGTLLLERSHGGNGAAWGLSDCAACHPIARIHEGASTIRSIVEHKGYDTCSGCHGTNGGAEQRQCAICHNAKDLPSTPFLDGIHSHTFNSEGGSGQKDSDCVACHKESDMDGVFVPEQDLTALANRFGVAEKPASVTEFCLGCHNRDHQQSHYPLQGYEFDDPMIAMEDNYNFIDKHGIPEGNGARTFNGLRSGYHYQSVVACTDCHAMHGSNNQKLIIDNSLKGVSLLNPDIREQGYKVETLEGDLSQLCVLCHNMQLVLDSGDVDAGNDLKGVHEVGVDCVPCHSHGEAVQAGL